MKYKATQEVRTGASIGNVASETSINISKESKVKLGERYSTISYDINGDPIGYILPTEIAKLSGGETGTIFFNKGIAYLGIYDDKSIKESRQTVVDQKEYLNIYGDKDSEKRITSNVDLQDNVSLEDLDNISEISWGAIGNSTLTTFNSYTQNILSPIDTLTSLGEGNGTTITHTKNKAPNEENNSVKEKAFSTIDSIKNDIKTRKNIKMLAKQGPYNKLSNIVGLASLISVGGLGNGDSYSWDENKDLGSNILNSLTGGATLETDSGVLEAILHANDAVLGVRHTNAESIKNVKLDADEIAALNTVAFNTLMGNKPGHKTGVGANAPERSYYIQNKIKDIKKTLKNRNNFFRCIGKLYVEPFYNNQGFECFSIPFEFNPRIQEGSLEAKYNETTLINKFLPIRSYVNTSSSATQIEATYMALAKDDSTILDNLSISETDEWMYDWTNKQIERIELQLRSLVMGNLVDKEFVRPPIVQIRMGVSKSIFDNEDYQETGSDEQSILYKYPEYESNYMKITNSLGEATRYKRYIVTSVQISPLDSYGNSFVIPSESNNIKTYRRNGFKVTLSLSETTKNFLDLVPDYSVYYNAWNKDRENEIKEKEKKLRSLYDRTDSSVENASIASLNQYADLFWSANSTFYNDFVRTSFCLKEDIFGDISKKEKEIKDVCEKNIGEVNSINENNIIQKFAEEISKNDKDTDLASDREQVFTLIKEWKNLIKKRDSDFNLLNNDLTNEFVYYKETSKIYKKLVKEKKTKNKFTNDDTAFENYLIDRKGSASEFEVKLAKCFFEIFRNKGYAEISKLNKDGVDKIKRKLELEEK